MKIFEISMRQLILRINSVQLQKSQKYKILFKQWRFLIIGNRLGLARESTYKFACLHDKGGSEKLRNAISFFRLPKGTNRPNGENNASKNRPPLILLFDSYTSILTKTPQNCIQITQIRTEDASRVILC